MAKKNLSQIAKKTATVKQVEKPVAVAKEVVIAKPIDKGEDKKLSDVERDLKAKTTIETLLSDIELPDIGKKALINEEVEEAGEPIDDPAAETDWYDEQIQTLNQIIDNQRMELERLSLVANNGYVNNDFSVNDSQTVQGLIELFVEIQNVYDNLKRANGELIIYPIQFLDKMMVFFPFLRQYRRQLIGEM